MKNLFVLLSIVLTTSRGCDSCKEDIKTSCSESNTLLIPQEMKDRFWFKDSSYWIYKDSVSGQIDSCWILESNIGIDNAEKIEPISKGKCFEGRKYMTESLIQQKYQTYLNPIFSRPNTEFDNETFYIIFSVPNFRFERIIYKGNSLNAYNAEGGKVIKINKMNVNGKEYSDIIFLYYTLPSIDIYKRIYYANKIGIIKYEDKSGRVWELVRYRVKQ